MSDTPHTPHTPHTPDMPDGTASLAFAGLDPDRIPGHIARRIADARQALVALLSLPAVDWATLESVLGEATDRLHRDWSVVQHLAAVNDSPALRQAIGSTQPQVVEFWTQLGASAELYRLYERLDPATLTPEQARARTLALRGFVLSGARLDGPQRQRFAAIQARLAALSRQFSENTLDATDGWHYLACEAEVAGLPEDTRQALAEAARADGHAGQFKLSLKMPVYLAVMQFAQDRQLRARLHWANATRASDLSPPDQAGLDNTPVIGEILALRRELAGLLGFASFAELSMATKMADSPSQVQDFLHDLAARARPSALQDVAALRAFASDNLGIDDPQPWDWSFISEQLKQARYRFSAQELKPYFPFPSVLQGLFRLAEGLFGIAIHAEAAEGWHPSVSHYRIEQDGQVLGRFYLDPFVRPGKRGGAWMNGIVNRWKQPGAPARLPVALIVCNFAEGVGGQPALMQHGEVVTLFHEFGHALHHLLTRVDTLAVSGIQGVEWDAVELPSQMMENFCWEWPVLQTLAIHAVTGEPLPEALYRKMLAAKNFQAGLQTLAQVERSLVDMQLHSSPAPDVVATLQAVNSRIGALPQAPYMRYVHSFSHLFAGGYAAGYYSYQWAEVLSADAYAAFEEEAGTPGMAERSTGERYRRSILEAGGSRPAIESFQAFRGRAPSIDAMLRHRGMAAAAA